MTRVPGVGGHGVIFQTTPNQGGGVPVEQDLGGMRPEALPTHLVPAIVRVADVGAEQPQSGLAAPGRRLFATFDRAQIAEELFNARRHPRPGELDEALHERDPGVDGVVSEVAAQLLVTPARSMSSTVWASGCSRGTELTTYTRPLLSAGNSAS